MQEREHKCIRPGLLYFILAAVEFSRHSLFSSTYLLMALKHKSCLHFSLGILKNERLGFFPRLDGQKGTQQDVFSQDIALLIFWYPKQCARTALWDVVTIVNTSHRWIHIQILKYTSCVMSTHDCGIQ